MKSQLSLVFLLLLLLSPARAADYDRFALPGVSVRTDFIGPDADELAEMTKIHAPACDRLDRLARKVDGRLDSCASGQNDGGRFRRADGSLRAAVNPE